MIPMQEYSEIEIKDLLRMSNGDMHMKTHIIIIYMDTDQEIQVCSVNLLKEIIELDKKYNFINDSRTRYYLAEK